MGWIVIPLALLFIGPMSSTLGRSAIVSAVVTVGVDVLTAIAFQSIRPLTANGQFWALTASSGDIFLVWIWTILWHAAVSALLGAAGYGVKRAMKSRAS